jgi:apolipoprotein N-acyltransferase
MNEALAVEPPDQRRLPLSLISLQASVPSLRETALATSSALCLVLSFPNFDLWWLAWIGLVPLLFAVAKTGKGFTAFLLGLLWGTIFFYGTCWWLTYPMIRYGHLSAWFAYPLLLAPVIFVAGFPALACAFLPRLISRFGSAAVFAAPLLWVSFDWLRYVLTGQVWNAIGYSQAFHPSFIQPARWGGVYTISFLILAANAAFAFGFINRTILRILLPVLVLFLIEVILVGTYLLPTPDSASSDPLPFTFVVAVQPNVPMASSDDMAMQQLLGRHLDLSRAGLMKDVSELPHGRLIIWPESPMNFSYSADVSLQDLLASFARANHTAVMLNSLEKAPNGGSYNSAILVNEQGQKIAQYDKIRLMPFGEYVPLPRWLPGSGSVRSIVGEFTPGSSYTLMPLGDLRAGVFICVEAAHPGIARAFTNNGADVLINISNDGYLGPTPVMQQHLANGVFRAVENNRPLLRVTNSGISAYINPNGSVQGETEGFQEAVRTWTISKGSDGTAFYSRHGDLFAYACTLITLGVVSASLMTRRAQPKGQK